jgi:predicted nucleic acid-binding protein
MILVDTSVWIDHFRNQEPEIVKLLTLNGLLVHPYVVGELIMGNIKPLDKVIALLASLPRVEPVSEAKLYDCVIENGLNGTGLGFVDAHLIASAEHDEGITVWTRDKRLAAQAERLSIPYRLD